MPKTYVTIGQQHTHRINGHTIDKDCVAVINCTDAKDGCEKAFEFFGPKFCFECHEDRWDEANLKYFPRGYIEVN
jgi:hypothetical protein